MPRIRHYLAGILAAILNRYEGATYHPSRSIIPGALQSAKMDISAAPRSELSRKARWFEANSPIVNKMADVWESALVGSGPQLVPASSDPAWNQRATPAWLEWSESPDLCSEQSLGTLAGLGARCWFVDGESFMLPTFDSRGIPRIQMIESHLCGTPPRFAELEGESICDGVQIDAVGKPIGYWFATEGGRGQDRVWRPVDAQNVIHLFEPSRPGQYRGLTMLHAVLNDLVDMDDLHLLEMQAAKKNARIDKVVKTASGEMDPSELRRAGFKISKTLASGATASVDRERYYQDVVGAQTIVMRKDDELEIMASDRPSAQTMDYWQLKLEWICNGVGLPYMLVFPDSMQGTVVRAVMDQAATFFQARFGPIGSALKRVYRHWANWARYNHKELRDAPADWQRVSVHPPRAINVDVGRNSSAMLAELQAGATNYARIYGPLGLNWREEFAALAEQLEFARKLGLNLASAAPVQALDDDDDDDEPAPQPARAMEADQ